jgi:chromosome segregation ATPase
MTDRLRAYRKESEDVMEQVVILLCSLSGALVGTALGILLMFPRLRPPITDAELATLKGKLRTTEASLAANTAGLENFRRQIVERDQAIQRNEEALQERQQQLEIATAERAAAEQRSRELSVQAEALTEQHTQLEAKVKEERDAGAAMANQQVASYEAQLDSDKRQVQELTEQVARLTAEAAEIEDRCEQEKLHRSSLETKLSAGTEHIQELTARIQELQREQSLFDLRLQEERQSAAKGMELLVMAQENLARVFKSRGGDAPNGSNGHGLLEAAGAIVMAQGEGTEELVPALARE